MKTYCYSGHLDPASIDLTSILYVISDTRRKFFHGFVSLLLESSLLALKLVLRCVDTLLDFSVPFLNKLNWRNPEAVKTVVNASFRILKRPLGNFRSRKDQSSKSPLGKAPRIAPGKIETACAQSPLR